MGKNNYETQLLINMASNFASEERYQLQQTKTVCIPLKNTRNLQTEKVDFELNGASLKNVDTAPHLGITRTPSLSENVEVNVSNNIIKARRTLYSLFGTGMHGENGLDPCTVIHVYNVYVLPVLLYGLELITPPQKYIDKLELFQKKSLKQLLSLSDKAADSAVYILSGVLPVQANLDLRILGFFNNLCNQTNDSLEKKIFIRQLTVKNDKSYSWAVRIPPLLARYNLDSAFAYIENPVEKILWKRSIRKIVEDQWKTQIENQSGLYSSLKYMNCDYNPGSVHPSIRVPCASTLEVSRMAVRLKLLTGTYILQSNRARFNQNAVNPVCQLCYRADETVEHFVFHCPTLEEVRRPIVASIRNRLQETGLQCYVNTPNDFVQLIIDYSCVIPPFMQKAELCNRIEFDSRRLLFALHKTREAMYGSSLFG